VSWYDIFLFLHVLSAAAFLGLALGFWAVVVATRPGSPLLSARAAGLVTAPMAVAIGPASVGALLFGVALAINVDGYELWDGWILASVVLWIVGGAAGARSGRELSRALEGGEASRGARNAGLVLHAVGTAALVLILYLMVAKPGA
jgi:uncharacterized membrane protein